MTVLAMPDTLTVLLLAGVGSLLITILAMVDTPVVMLLAGVGLLLITILAMFDALVVMQVMTLLGGVRLLLVLFLVGLDPMLAILRALVISGLVPLGLLLADGLPGVLPAVAMVVPQLAGLLPMLVHPLGTIAALGELLVQTVSGPLIHPVLESGDLLGMPPTETLRELVDLGQTVRVVSLDRDLTESAQFRDAVTILAFRESGFPLLRSGRRFCHRGRIPGPLGTDGRRHGTQGQRNDSNPAKTNDIHVPAPQKDQVARSLTV
jgi:hypothetical protein